MKLVVMESERSEVTSERFLSLLQKEFLVMMLPSREFQDEDFLEQLEKKLGGFDVWPLRLERPISTDKKIHPDLDKAPAGFLVRSSGTSGTGPKMIVHEAALFVRKFSNSRPSFQTTLNFFPPDSIAGIETLLESTVHGTKIIQPGKEILPSRILDLLLTEKIDYLHITPTFMNMLLLHGLSEKHLESVKTLAFGSEPSQPRILDQIRNLKPEMELRHNYGMSEIGLQATITNPSRPSYFKFDHDVNPARVNGGLLEVKTHTPPFKIMDTLHPGEWFPTGDQVELSGDWLKITGRSDDIINVAGKKFFPSVLEDLFMEWEGIQDATVVSEPNELIGNSVTVRISTSTQDDLIRSQLKSFMEAKIPAYMRPQRIEILKSSEVSARLKKKRR